ncbi:sugar ABC transporter substrate-binding protein [Streptomyces sp. NPDC056716]|uniref:sugar ABC transporter substrate-binding protein n=1 Tax=unclassified Streptomyces TaxID=2593676 RepID=UPI0036A03D1C
MKVFRRSLTGAATACAALGLVATACSPGSSSDSSTSADCAKTYTFGFSHSNAESAYVIGLSNAIQRAADADGCTKVLFDTTQNGDLEHQRSTVESWVTQKVDAIVVVPVEASALEGLRSQAQSQGTKWISYAVPVTGGDGSVGFDNAASGRLAGEAALKFLQEKFPEGGATAAITTSQSTTWSPRNTEARKVLEDAGIEVVSYQECNTQACGLQIAEDTLREHPDLRVFIGNNDDAGLGAVRAFSNAGVPDDQVFIVGQDGGSEALEQLLTNGTFRATVAIPLDDLAKSVLTTVHNAVNGEGKTDNVTPVTLVYQDEKDRINELLAQFEK